MLLYIGNIFYLDRKFDWKAIFISLVATSVVGFIQYIIEQETIGLTDLAYGVMTAAVAYFITIRKVLFDEFLKDYFSDDLLPSLTLRLGLHFPLFISFFIIDQFYIGLLWGFFYFISTFLFHVIEESPAIFRFEIHKYMEIIQLYAFLRATSYLIALLMVYEFFSVEFFSSDSIIWFICGFVINLIQLANLSSYMIKHPYVKCVIQLIRKVQEEAPNKISIKELEKSNSCTTLNVERQMQRLSSVGLIEIYNGYVRIGERLKEVSNR